MIFGNELFKRKLCAMSQSPIISPTEVIARALSLPHALRATLAEQLLWSLDQEDDSEIDPEVLEEAEKLARDVHAGRIKTIPWEQVKRELRERRKG